MTKIERELLSRTANAYYFIMRLRNDAIRRKDGYYIEQTNGIDEAIDRMHKSYPQFKKAFVNAKKKAEAPVQRQAEETKTKGSSKGKAKNEVVDPRKV